MLPRLPTDHDADFSAPEADLGFFEAVDGAVFPFGEGGGVGGGVDVVGGGVVGEIDEAFAVSEIDLDLQHVEEGSLQPACRSKYQRLGLSEWLSQDFLGMLSGLLMLAKTFECTLLRQGSLLDW